MEISAVISSYLMHVRVEKALSVNTISAYKRDLQKFDEFARKRKLVLESVGRDDLVDFLAGLYRLKLHSRTVARQLVTLRNFFRFAQIQDLIADDPSINLESPRFAGTCPDTCGWRRSRSCWSSRTPERPWDCATARCWRCCIQRDC